MDNLKLSELSEHPSSLHASLRALYDMHGECYVNIFCMNGVTYFTYSLTYTDQHSAEAGGKAEQLPDNIVYFKTIKLF